MWAPVLIFRVSTSWKQSEQMLLSSERRTICLPLFSGLWLSILCFSPLSPCVSFHHPLSLIHLLWHDITYLFCTVHRAAFYYVLHMINVLMAWDECLVVAGRLMFGRTAARCFVFFLPSLKRSVVGDVFMHVFIHVYTCLQTFYRAFYSYFWYTSGKQKHVYVSFSTNTAFVLLHLFWFSWYFCLKNRLFIHNSFIWYLTNSLFI